MSSSKHILTQCVCSNLKGLKIHIGRCHKDKCEEYGIGFKDSNAFKRHIEAKLLLSNIESVESPDLTKILFLKVSDETCLVVSDQTVAKNVAIIHSEECWSRCGHSCPDLVNNRELEDINKDIPHLLISSVVLGDLSMPGCFMDWNSLAVLIGQHNVDQLS
jgi:hypothetical protein